MSETAYCTDQHRSEGRATISYGNSLLTGVESTVGKTSSLYFSPSYPPQVTRVPRCSQEVGGAEPATLLQQTPLL